MFEIHPITDELLAELGTELGGCDFTDPRQREFLAERGSCDVQAAPGNGKTTLLAAKLALLSRGWTLPRQGVCVMSHTNAARTEVEEQIAKHATASLLMAYPHFVGTVTAFINQFLALPYLRGLGWSVRQIDDDAFSTLALRKYSAYPALRYHAKRAGKTVEDWVTHLELDPDASEFGSAPRSLAVRHRKGQHGPTTKCGEDLARLKAALVNSGIYRYADMTALAWHALRAIPDLADRLRKRFPLVILDEAQDTNGQQLKLLEHLFKDRNTAFQRLGDSNQTLYPDDREPPVCWTPGEQSIPLDSSRRFGPEIAAFASRLTTRKAQTIVGVSTRAASRVMILFDEATIGGVLPAFAAEARAHWGDRCATRDVWAVASRHNLPGGKKGAWEPKSLVSYHPAYRSEGGERGKSDSFCALLQKAAVCHHAGRQPAEVMEMFATGIAGIAHMNDWKAPSGQPVTARTIWTTLAQRDPELSRKVRRLLYDHVLHGDGPWREEAWRALVGALLPLFAPLPNQADGGRTDELVRYCEFVGEQKADIADPERHSPKQVNFGELTLRLGSIHSVKGKTVDGVLVVETELWKGWAANERCIDLTTVLPRAFGLTDDGFIGIAQAAATNVFVGVTRPRELLGLAVRKSTAAALVDVAEAQGWKVVDLVAGAPGAVPPV